MSTENNFLGIFGKIIAVILSVFASNWDSGKFIRSLWKKVPDELQDKVSIGVEVVELLKKAIDSGTVDVLTAIIPGRLDDEAVFWLRVFLPKLLDKYKILTSPDEFNNAQVYHNFATEVTQEATGLSYGQCALTTEVSFQNLVKNA